MSRGWERDNARRQAERRQWLARDLRKLADPSLDHDGQVYKAAIAAGVHPEDFRSALAALALRLDPERVRL